MMKPQKFSISDILTRSPTTDKHNDKETHLKAESDSHEIPSLPTPPRSPERDTCKNQDAALPKKHSNYTVIRKRDPIGQILDNLCSESKKKSNPEQSAFSPVITSSYSPHLSPLPALAQCDRRCFQMSPEAIGATYRLGVVRNEELSPAQTSVEQLQYLQAQKLALGHQQQLQQQQQAALSASVFPYMLQSGVARNLQQMQIIRSQQEQLAALENYKANLLTSREYPANLSPPNTNTPFWMAWMKCPTGSNMASFPGKETRAPPPPRYQCDACKKSYSTFGGLSKHKQFHCVSHVKKEFNCKFCEKSYGSLGALKMHIRTHTLPCKCKLCGKAFSRPWLLQGHVRTHTGEKPFKCAHCGRAFADRSNLRAHLQTHSDIKKYGCKNCTKTFSRMSLLLKHEEGSCLGLRR